MNQKGFATILMILGIVLLLGVAGGAYYFGQSSIKTPTSGTQISASISPTQPITKTTVSPTPTIDETANWKTYTTNEYSFKYPENWTFTTEVKIKDANISLTNFVINLKKQTPYGVFSQKETSVDGKSALIQEVSAPPAGRQIFVFILRGNTSVFSIYARNVNYSDPSVSFPNSVTQEFTKILSTFKFLDKSQSQNSLVPADADSPASGVCGDLGSATIATINLNEDMSVPRCVTVLANQQLEVINNTNQTVTFTLGQNSLLIGPNQKKTITQTFGSYLAPGVHFTKTSLYGGGGPEIWLQ